MASVTILSDNGATSGSAGLKTSGGNDGVLLLQTTTSGGTPTTAISISNTQVVTYTNQPTYTGGTANGVLYLNGSKAVTSGTALVFDGTNLGLGVTPSAWISTNKAFQFGYGAVRAFTNSANTYLDNNNYVNSSGTDIYLNNGYAGRYRIADNQHIWYQAASGTAGNAITFTQAMTLDASGRLGIGVTSPSCLLDVETTSGSGRQEVLRVLAGPNATNNGASLTLGSTQTLCGYLSGLQTASNEGALVFGTQSSGAYAERARIDSSGNFNLNTTGAFGKFCADIGAYVFTAGQSGSSLTWGTSSTSGRPCITVASTGTGQDSAFRTVVSPDNGASWRGWTSGINIETGSDTLSWCINTNNNASRVFGSGGVAMRLTTGGALSTVTGSLGTISDIRMKKDVVDATPKLDQLMQLRVVNYVLIDDPEERKMLGFVAQEVEQVFAGLIEEHDILDPETKEVTMHQKTVKTTVLIPMLVKAMQEQQAIITQLQADVAALKGQA